MKNPILAFLIFLPLMLPADVVRPGDSVESVLSTMGAPRGRLQMKERERLCYDQGEIEVSAGVVTRVTLRSDEAQAAFEERNAANAERVRNEQARLTEVGEALKSRQLSEPAFRSAPLSYQVKFWENFSRRYPAVSSQEELNLARARLADQQESARAEAYEVQRLADLEARAAEEAGEERDRQYYYPVFTGNSYGYGRDYYHEASRRRLDQEYFDRIRPRSADAERQHDAARHEPGRNRDHPQSREHSAIFCDTSSRPTATVIAERSQVSSHTAMAFAGKDWLVWPSPAQSLR